MVSLVFQNGTLNPMVLQKTCARKGNIGNPTFVRERGGGGGGGWKEKGGGGSGRWGMN